MKDRLLSVTMVGYLISPGWRAGDQRRMHVTPDLHLQALHPESTPYLEFHRDVMFERSMEAGDG